jgi:hypothetical protein
VVLLGDFGQRAARFEKQWQQPFEVHTARPFFDDFKVFEFSFSHGIPRLQNGLEAEG